MMKKTGLVVVLALGCGLSLQALARGYEDDVPAVTKSECERKADNQNFGSHSDRHWYVLRCMTQG